MKYDWMDAELMRKAGVSKDFKAEWNWIRYLLGDKMFAAVCLDGAGQPTLITLKLDPQEGEFLRGQYEDILPGYYMNKVHWNSVRADGAVPDELLRELLERSYRLVLGKLSRRKREELLSQGGGSPE